MSDEEKLLAEISRLKARVGDPTARTPANAYWQTRVRLKDQEITHLRSLVRTYAKMPFPCHDYMAKEQWEAICRLCSEE